MLARGAHGHFQIQVEGADGVDGDGANSRTSQMPALVAIPAAENQANDGRQGSSSIAKSVVVCRAATGQWLQPSS
jgi:hypothetical protein